MKITETQGNLNIKKALISINKPELFDKIEVDVSQDNPLIHFLDGFPEDLKDIFTKRVMNLYKGNYLFPTSIAGFQM